MSSFPALYSAVHSGYVSFTVPPPLMLPSPSLSLSLSLSRHELDDMKWALSALLLSALVLASSLAALPDRSCSNTLNLCTQESRAPSNCVLVDEDPAMLCNTRSLYHLLEQRKAVVSADDCLQVNIYPGTYSLSLYTDMLNYSAVISAPEGGVRVTCESECVNTTNITSSSPLWFQRSSPEGGEFFVQLEGISFESCPRPLQFDAMDYVDISNCNFT